MTDGFIRGQDSGVREVDLLDILPPDMKAFSTQARQIEFVGKYETKTGTLVRLPWETAEERAKRRLGFKPLAPASTIGGDPVRIQRALDGVIAEIIGLTLDHPDHANQLAILSRRANQYELSLGRKLTDYTRGQIKPREPEPSEELKVKWAAYSALSDKKRKESAQATPDTDFLKMIRDQEGDKAIVEIAVTRLIGMGQMAA